MTAYRGGRVLSIRIDPDLLEAVRERARTEGRSVSGEVVFIVRNEIEARPAANEKPRPISGWLGRRDSPETHAGFQKGRAAISANLLRAVRRRAQES